MLELQALAPEDVEEMVWEEELDSCFIIIKLGTPAEGPDARAAGQKGQLLCCTVTAAGAGLTGSSARCVQCNAGLAGMRTLQVGVMQVGQQHS